MKLFIGIFLIAFALPAFSADAGKPLERASKAYLTEGVDAFIPALLKGSALEGEKSVLTQSNSIRQIEAYLGSYQGFDIIHEKALTSKVRIVYYAMNYDKSAVFGVATYYKVGGEEVISNFNFHTEWQQILPANAAFE